MTPARAGGRRTFALLESQYAQQPWIVVCTDEDRPNWRDVLSRGGACEVIARGEISVATFAAALDQGDTAAARPHAPTAATAAQALQLALMWVLALRVMAVVAGAGWWMSHSRAPARQPSCANGSRNMPAASSPARRLPALAGRLGCAPQGVEGLLSMARVAFRDPAAQLPKPDMPHCRAPQLWNCMAAVLLQQPNNKEALDGVRRLQAVAR